MDERYYDIPEAHKQTFQWIYEKEDLKFVDWLKKGDGVYWITGKAGSGKSTLMKFLYKDPRTRNSLPVDISNILISGFFFHDRGENQYLKSQEGQFRAILHNIISAYPQLIPIILPQRWKKMMSSLMFRANDSQNSGFHLTELKDAFQELTARKVLNLHLCLLIDGLDEFSGHHQHIIETLAALLLKSNDGVVRVQLCLSSRPLVLFEDAYLTKYLHLKVQDLTKDDIQKYVTDNSLEIWLRMTQRLRKKSLWKY